MPLGARLFSFPKMEKCGATYISHPDHRPYFKLAALLNSWPAGSRAFDDGHVLCGTQGMALQALAHFKREKRPSPQQSFISCLFHERVSEVHQNFEEFSLG